MDSNKPLSRFGIGPVYAGLVFAMTLAALVLNHFGVLPALMLQSGSFPLKLLGAVFVVIAAVLWVNAVIIMRIAQHISKNELVTSGSYAWVRNPIYTAIMFLMWGLLLQSGNLLLLILCPVHHLLMTVLVKRTEEKWLAERYGKAYLDYCEAVNRCIPCPPRNKGGK